MDETGPARRSLDQSVADLRAALECAADGAPYATLDATLFTPAIEPLARALNRLVARQREAEEGQRHSEAKYRCLAEEGHAVVYVIDLRTGTAHIMMDEQIEARLGYTREEWQANFTLLEQRLHPDDRDRVLTAKTQAIERGEPLDIEYRLLSRHDVMLWVHDHATVERDHDGTPVRLHGVALNITTRRRIEEALHESERRFERMARELPHVIFRWGLHGLEYISPACLQVFGRTAEEILASADPGGLLVHPDDRARAFELATNLMSGPVQIEVRALRPNGDIVWIEQNLLPIFDSNGVLVAVEGVACDITDRRHMETAVRESEELFHTLASLSPVGIFHTDAQGLCTYVNEPWLCITGISLAEALGGGWPRALHPDDRELVREEWSRVVGTRAPFRAEYRFQRPDGQTTWVLGQATAETNSAGELRGYVGTITDITDRKQAELALQESEARYRDIFEHASVSLWEMDLSALFRQVNELRSEGVDDIPRYLNEHPQLVRWAVDSVKVLDVNQESLQLFGARSKEQLLAPLSQVFLPETFSVFAELVAVIAAGRVHFRTEAPARTLDGRHVNVLASVTLPSEASPLAPTLVSLIDITERKRVEQALLDAERGKRDAARTAADAERRRLARELHDGALQDLGAVKLFLEVERKQQRPGQLDPALERLTAVISELRAVVDNLQPGDLGRASLQEAIAAHAKWLTRPNGIALTLNLDPDVCIARVSVRDLYRVAQEALANAVQHGSPSHVAVRLFAGDHTTVLEIDDNGSGFDVTAPHHGMGLLGMRERAAALGGDLAIASAAGEGTRVRVIIPSANANGATAVDAVTATSAR